MNWIRRGLAVLVSLVVLIGLVAAYRTTLTPVTLVIDGEPMRLQTHQPTVEMLLADRGISLRAEDRLSPGRQIALAADMAVTIERARPVVIVVDGREKLIYAHEESPADLLAQSGVALGRFDHISLRPPSVTDPKDTRVRIVVARAREVMLEEGGVRTTLQTHAETVGEAVLQAGIRLYRADRVIPDPATPLEHGMHIYLDRSVPVNVIVDGHTLRTRTHRSRVGEVLADLGVTVNGQDYTDPPLDAPLTADIAIQVFRVTESVVVEQSPIPFDSEWQPDPDSEIDTQGLLREGEPGVLERRTRLRYVNGQVVDRRVEGENVVVAPKNRVMGYGTKIVVRTLDTPSGPVDYWRVVRMLATSYSASTAGVSRSSPHYGYTFTGLKMRTGLVAVDPGVISLGSEVYVPGYGVGLAADTGGAIKGKRIDLGYADDELELWYRWVDVYMMTPVPDDVNYIAP
jgi:resuscitation-promoting factor RpfB